MIQRIRQRLSIGRLRTAALALRLALLPLLVAGCATSPPTAPPPATMPAPSVDTPTAPPAQTPGPAPQPRADTANATLALLEQSERAAASGSLTEAIAYAERAVRIDPRQPQLWTRLAGLELENQHPQTAIQYATKAVSLSGNRLDWQRDAWLVIADAKEALGFANEAAQIRERWRSAKG